METPLMARAATPAETARPVVEATPEVAAAVRAYVAARTAYADVTQTDGLYSRAALRAGLKLGEARDALEALILPDPLPWRVVDGRKWTALKVGWGGWQVVDRPHR